MIKNIGFSPFKKLALASAVLCAHSAVSNASSLTLEEVVVTAQKRAQSLQDVSVSVAVTDGEMIADKAITNIENLSASLPAVTIAENVLSQFVFVRGIGTPGINQGQEQAVGMFTDGIYMGRATLARAPMMDVSRVEVLRGPQSIFFGKNTTAGAIGVYSNDPTQDFEGKVSALSAPEDDETELNFVLSGPLSEDLSARLALRKYELEGYQKNVFDGSDTPERDDLTARLKLQWDISDSATLKTSYERNEFERNGAIIQYAGQDPLAPPSTQAVLDSVFSRIGNQKGDDDIDTGNAKALASMGLTDTTLPDSEDTSDAASDVFILSYDQDFDRHAFTAVYGYADYDHKADASITPLLPFIDSIHTEEYSQHSLELRLQSTEPDELEYLVGLFYQSSDLDYAEDNIFGVSLLDPTAPNIGRRFGLDQETETVSVFGSTTWHVADDLRAVVGLRFQQEEKKGRQYNAHYLSGGTIADYDALQAVGATAALDAGLFQGLIGSHEHDFSDRIDKDSTTWSLKVEYDLTEESMVYASISTGLKAGGFDARYVGAVKDELTFDDEEALNFELGLRQTLMDGRMRLSATAYQTTIEDYQVSIYDGVVNFLVQNAAELTSRGLELEVDFAATENLTISTAFAYLDSTWDSFDDGPCSSESTLRGDDGCTPANQFTDFSGKSNIFSPEWTGFVSFDYRREFAGLEYASVLDISYSDEYATAADLDSNSFYDAWTTVDLRLSVGDPAGDWQVALVGKNLTDEEKGNSRQDFALLTGAYFTQIDRASSVALQAVYNF